MGLFKPLTEAEKLHYNSLNKENVEFLLNRYNKVNRWVIADIIRREQVSLSRQAGRYFPG